MRRLRLGLLGRFTVASLVPIVGLGIVLAHTLSGQIRERAIAAAMTQTQLLADVCVAPLVSETALHDGLTAPGRERLDDEFRMLVDMDVARLEVLDTTGRVVYANDAELIGRTLPVSELLQRALDGSVVSATTRLSPAERTSTKLAGDLLTVFVPFRETMHNEEAGAEAASDETHMPDAKPIGAFEVSIPYAPIEAAIARDVRRLYLYLAAGLLVLYVSLASILLRARRHEYFALHDSLTGLPNRLLFRDSVEQAARAVARDGSTAAVMILDVDRFKNVNDTLGHSSGDAVIQQVSERLRRCLRDTDTIARLGGDEFAVLLRQVADAAAAERVAESLTGCFAEPFEVDEIRLDLTSSVGIAMMPAHGTDVETLLRRADVAMYTAKGARGGPCVYSSAFDRHSPAKLMLVGELRRAIRNEELIVHYQPMVDPESRQVVGAEALVRWQHPQHGLLMPHTFVPLAEDTALIQKLTAYVLERALEQRRVWADHGRELALAINVSVWDVLDPGFPRLVRDLLEKTATPPGSLTLEVTETVILHDRAAVAAVLARLKEIGVRIALDDFGRGYTSLGAIKELPIDQIKIDKSFVLGLDDEDAEIIRSTAALGRKLGLEIVAEGVENERALDTVRDLGCDIVQGYFLGRPGPAADISGIGRPLRAVHAEDDVELVA